MPFRILLLVMLWVTAAYGEIYWGESLEWLACSSSDAALMVVESFQAPPSESKYANVSLQVRKVETLKGEPPQQDTLPCWYSMSAPPGSPHCAPRKGDRHLIFWRGGARVRVISLLGHPDETLLSRKLEILTQGEPILEVTRSWCHRTAKPKRVEIPSGTPAYQAVWGGSACYLTVPEEP